MMPGAESHRRLDHDQHPARSPIGQHCITLRQIPGRRDDHVAASIAVSSAWLFSAQPSSSTSTMDVDALVPVACVERLTCDVARFRASRRTHAMRAARQAARWRCRPLRWGVVEEKGGEKAFEVIVAEGGADRASPAPSVAFRALFNLDPPGERQLTATSADRNTMSSAGQTRTALSAKDVFHAFEERLLARSASRVACST